MRLKDLNEPKPYWKWRLKSSQVNVDDLHPNIINYLGTLEPKYQDMILATSGNDGVHTEFSRHYKNNAVDLRIHNRENPLNDELYKRIEKDPLRLKFGLTLIDPNHGTAPHIDLSFGKGTQNKKDVFIDPHSVYANNLVSLMSDTSLKFDKQKAISEHERLYKQSVINTSLPETDLNFINSLLLENNLNLPVEKKDTSKQDLEDKIAERNFLVELASLDAVEIIDKPSFQTGGQVPIDNTSVNLTLPLDVPNFGTVAPYEIPNEIKKQEVKKPENIGLYIKNQLVSKGFTIEDALAIVGNIEVESAGFKYDVLGDLHMDTPSFGLMQWRGERLKKLKERYGDSPSLDNQIDYISWELQGGNKYETYQFNKVKDTTTLDEKVRAFAKYVERPSEEALLHSLKRRQSAAKKYL